MEKLLKTARKYGARVGNAHRAGDREKASQHWGEYVCWYQALLNDANMSIKQFDAIDVAFKEAEREEALADSLEP